MDIGEAVQAMRSGRMVQRAGWNGKGMWIALRDVTKGPEAGARLQLPYIYMKTVQDEEIPWLCSQADLLAEDWQLAT